MSDDAPSVPPPATPPGADVVGPGHTPHSVTEKISEIVLTERIGRGWLVGFLLSASLVMLMLYSILILLLYGVGVWGVNIPVAWGFAIINFVWWIGIGHAGTLISAILLLLRQEWRTSINRFAEAMTLFAVACAGLFPLLHVGRPWLAYWLFPYSNTMNLWPGWRSPLVWDVFAVSTYALTSLLFWYVGLIPDLATIRDRAPRRWVQRIYGVLALGWRGSARHWHRYERAYLLLAGLATPLVISVHSVVSLDFASSVLPGWHVTIFPPYFVAGAIYAGFAMVLTLVIPLRVVYGLQDFITMRHLDNMAKVMLASGLIVAYGYAMEIAMGLYGGNEYEVFMLENRILSGPYAWAFWALMLCNVAVPQLLWSRRIRNWPLVLWLIAMVINVGMWLERFVIVVVSLHRDFLPSSWGMYFPTRWDWALYAGSIGFFLFLMFVFIRLLPMISVFEMRELVYRKAGRGATAGGGAAGRVGDET